MNQVHENHIKSIKVHMIKGKSSQIVQTSSCPVVFRFRTRIIKALTPTITTRIYTC